MTLVSEIAANRPFGSTLSTGLHTGRSRIPFATLRCRPWGLGKEWQEVETCLRSELKSGVLGHCADRGIVLLLDGFFHSERHPGGARGNFYVCVREHFQSDVFSAGRVSGKYSAFCARIQKRIVPSSYLLRFQNFGIGKWFSSSFIWLGQFRFFEKIDPALRNIFNFGCGLLR